MMDAYCGRSDKMAAYSSSLRNFTVSGESGKQKYVYIEQIMGNVASKIKS
jgi:hypothetical protein